MQTRNRKPVFPLLLLFVLVTAIAVVLRKKLEGWGANADVILIGNLVLMAVTLLSYLLAQKGIKSENTYGFLRGVYSSILLKLVLCVAAAFIYIAAAGKAVNMPALFILMGLYLAYTFIEVTALTKQLQRNP